MLKKNESTKRMVENYATLKPTNYPPLPPYLSISQAASIGSCPASTNPGRSP